MPSITDKRGSGEHIQAITSRADGTIRQILVQDDKKNIIARGFFPEGTTMSDDLKSLRMYSWVDSFSDKELTDPANGLIFSVDAGVLAYKRHEAIQANKDKRFVVEDIESYKIENYQSRAITSP